MAADNRSVVITLKSDGGRQASSDVSEQVDVDEASQKNTKKNSAKNAAIALGMQSANLAINEVVQWSEYLINREISLTDDYIGQRNKNIAYTYINKTISSATTIGSMAATGASIGGVWGAVIGAAIGTATVVAGITRSNIQGNDAQQQMLAQRDAQLNFTRNRAGWSLKAGSIGEDL